LTTKPSAIGFTLLQMARRVILAVAERFAADYRGQILSRVAVILMKMSAI